MISDGNPILFNDIEEHHKHYRDIASALSVGLILGVENQAFNPDSLITKEELAVIIARGLTKYDNKKYNAKVTAKLDKYSDVKEISPWAMDQIALLLELGILVENDESINPKANLTREEVAIILGRLYR